MTPLKLGYAGIAARLVASRNPILDWCMGDAEQYTKNAQEWRKLARKMPRGTDRTKFEGMAEEWERLAAETQRKPKGDA